MNFISYPSEFTPDKIISSDNFRRILVEADLPDASYQLWPGFIPHCFEGFDAPISLAIVDVDQHAPTAEALRWVWPRIKPGGVLLRAGHTAPPEW